MFHRRKLSPFLTESIGTFSFVLLGLKGNPRTGNSFNPLTPRDSV